MGHFNLKLPFVLLCAFALATEFPSTEASVLFMNIQYGTCLQVPGGGAANNLGLNLGTCHCPAFPGVNAQTWGEQWWTNSVNSVFSNGATGKCATVNGGVAGNGVIVNQYDCVDQTNQKWQITNGAYGGTFQIKTALAGGQCLSAEAGGTYVDLMSCGLTQALAPNQFWRMVQYS